MVWWYLPVIILVSWIGSHIIKEIAYIYRYKKFSWYTLFFETGGMPSSHAATVSAITMGVLMQEGFGALFWACLVFSGVVIRDAMGVRKSVSDQAILLNKLLGKARLHEKVSIVLGHTPLQVFVGVMLGMGVAIGFWYGAVV